MISVAYVSAQVASSVTPKSPWQIHVGSSADPRNSYQFENLIKQGIRKVHLVCDPVNLTNVMRGCLVDMWDRAKVRRIKGARPGVNLILTVLIDEAVD